MEQHFSEFPWVEDCYFAVNNDFALPYPGQSFGHQRQLDQSYRWNGMQRGSEPFTIWQYTVRGEGRVKFQGETLRVPAGHAFLLTVPEEHYYEFPENTREWELVYLSINGNQAVRQLKLCRRYLGTVYPVAPNAPELQIVRTLLERGMGKNSFDSFERNDLCGQFLSALARAATTVRQQQKEEPDFMAGLRQWMENRFSESLSVEQLAQRCNLSRSHFSRLFKAQEGVSPHQYLQELRLLRAMALLQTSRLRVKEIAESCGFSDTGHFIEAFANRFGTTPGKFRNGAQNIHLTDI